MSAERINIARAEPKTQQSSNRILIVDTDPQRHKQLRGLLPIRLVGVGQEPVSNLVPSGLTCSTVDIDSAYSEARALSMVERAVDTGYPYALVFLDGTMSLDWDGRQTLVRLWRADSRLEIVFCVEPSDVVLPDAVWRKLLNTNGTSDQLLLLERPYERRYVQQTARVLVKKWHTSHTRQRRISELQQHLAERASAWQKTTQQLEQEVAGRVRAERELRNAQRLEALGRLAAGLGHEINNPLSFLMSGAEAALEEVDRAESVASNISLQPLREMLDAVIVGADRISQIVKNIKLLSHRAENTAESVNLLTALKLALDMVRHDLHDAIQVSTELSDVPEIWCKRIEIEQVFLNLLRNAIHALSERNETGTIHVSSWREGEFAVVAIADNGPGMSKKTLDKVFEPFFTTKPAGVGTGLGLSICHAIIAGLGGKIEVVSELGRGTTATVWLPGLARVGVHRTDERLSVARDRTTPNKLTESADMSSTGERGRVLLIDDEPLIHRVVTHALGRHEVISAMNGRDALNQCQSRVFDVILCDLMMPEMNGMEFYHELQRVQPDAEADIVFFSGGSRLEEIQAFLDAVPNECLEKPVQRQRLQQLVGRYVAERASHRAPGTE